MICPKCKQEIDAFPIVKPPICYHYRCRIIKQDGTGCTVCMWNSGWKKYHEF